MAKPAVSIRDKKKIMQKIVGITQAIESNMFPREDVEHFKQRLKDLKRDYEQPE